MKLLLVTFLVASAFAAPSERTKRDILPGDDRYDPKLHGNPEDHKHQKTDVEISEAIGGFTGFITHPGAVSQFSEFGTGASFGDAEFLNLNADASQSFDTGSSIFKFGNTKFSEQLKSDVESNDASPKDESFDTLIPTTVPTTRIPSIPSNEKPIEGEEKTTKNTDETEFKTKSGSDETSSGVDKTIKPTPIEPKTSTKSIFSTEGEFASVSPSFFDSGFTSTDFNPSFPISTDFDTFHQTGYNPSIESFGESYRPSFNAFNTNYDSFGSNYGSIPLGFETVSVHYSKKPASISPQFFQFQNTYSNPPIVSSPSFTSFVDFSPQTTYFAPPVGEFNHQFYGTGLCKDQHGVLTKNQSPISTEQPTTVKTKKVESKINPETSNFSPPIDRKSGNPEVSKEQQQTFKQYQSPILQSVGHPNSAPNRSLNQPNTDVNENSVSSSSKLVDEKDHYFF